MELDAALPIDGTHLVAANVGVVMAQAGYRVLLVDAHLRAPGLHRLFGLPPGPGLADLLRCAGAPAGLPGRGDGGVDPAGPAASAARAGVHPVAVARGPARGLGCLAVVPAGTPAAAHGSASAGPGGWHDGCDDPHAFEDRCAGTHAGTEQEQETAARLLHSTAVTGCLAMLARGYDYVVVAGPAVLEAAEAALLAWAADATYLRVRLEDTSLGAAQAARDLLTGVGATLGGVIVEHVPPPGRGWPAPELAPAAGVAADHAARTGQVPRALDTCSQAAFFHAGPFIREGRCNPWPPCGGDEGYGYRYRSSSALLVAIADDAGRSTTDAVQHR
jgi:hypothetical protein